ncbi:MAG TPA: energy transducer TonB [Pyrinomonadaceae bacterium]|nr:energy transducer TonB [Pyrinomonadaceae bacterium]
MIRLAFLICGLLVVAGNAYARTSISVLDFGSTDFGKLVAEKLHAQLKAEPEFLVADADLSRSAANGVGYAGSLNLTLTEARDLGSALATDYYLLGDAQLLRRSSFEKPVYYESYCSVFLVSARTGRLLLWERPSFANLYSVQARDLLLKEITNGELSRRLLIATRRANEDERIQRAVISTSSAPVIEEAPDDEKAAEAQGLRLPRPFRRLRPEYPDTAARAEAEATVDVLVDVGADGEVGEVQVVRWAGFGLDEATIATIKQLHFFPALKNGGAIPMRVLLRYNFRKPPPRQ